MFKKIFPKTDPKALEEYRRTHNELDAYSNSPEGTAAAKALGDKDPEYQRRNTAAYEASKNVPWYRRG